MKPRNTKISVEAVGGSIFIITHRTPAKKYGIINPREEYYVHELTLKLHHRRTYGPFDSPKEAAAERRLLMTEHARWDESEATRRTHYQNKLHQHRQGRFLLLCANASKHLRDWSNELFQGPQYFVAAHTNKTTLFLRDGDLCHPGVVPVAVWLGPLCENYYPLLLHYSGRYHLFPYIGQYSHPQLQHLHEIRIFPKYTLALGESIT